MLMFDLTIYIDDPEKTSIFMGHNLHRNNAHFFKLIFLQKRIALRVLLFRLMIALVLLRITKKLMLTDPSELGNYFINLLSWCHATRNNVPCFFFFIKELRNLVNAFGITLRKM